MITFEQLQKANESIQTIEIKNNNYATVSQRIKAFRMLFPTGSILTKLISNENGICIIHATVGYRENGEFVVLGEGTAYEKESSSFINKTSYIENCETSAVGRALGMCGLGIDSDVASYEEVANVNLNTELIDATKKKALQTKLKNDNIPESYVCELFGIEQLKDLKMVNFVYMCTNWEKFLKKYNDRNNS